MIRNKNLRRIAGLIMFIVPFVLWILPADYFDYGQAWCPSKRFLDLECLGCGLTRGVQHAMHFDFEAAWLYNKLTFVVLPVMAIVWLYYVMLWLLDIDLKEKLGLKKEKIS